MGMRLGVTLLMLLHLENKNCARFEVEKVSDPTSIEHILVSVWFCNSIQRNYGRCSFFCFFLF